MPPAAVALGLHMNESGVAQDAQGPGGLGLVQVKVLGGLTDRERSLPEEFDDPAAVRIRMIKGARKIYLL
nr:hypothetical protein [Deinococcus taeanensis]